ncbi:hypothetical protein [Dactylosporangium sp. NPDC000521]|uniref:hypothetical protein n=1 Tax=Dactylosporangium sp. NPDC000521 TaxID=3363975 RepID=UPI0036891339
MSVTQIPHRQTATVEHSPGQLSLIIVMVQQDRGSAAVDLRVLPHADQCRTLLNAEALDQVIAALTEARQYTAGRATHGRATMAARRGKRDPHG